MNLGRGFFVACGLWAWSTLAFAAPAETAAPPVVEQDAAPPAADTPPADPPPADTPPPPARDDDFSDDLDAPPDQAEPEDFGDEADDAPDFHTPSAQLVTVPGQRRVREPPMIVGPSGNPRHALVYKNLLAARYNPIGVVDELTIGYRLQMLDKPGVLYRDSSFGAKLHGWFTPAFTRVGPRVELTPITPISLAASYEFVGYYRAFGLMQSFNSPTADYSDRVIDDLEAARTHYDTTGQFVTLAALLQAKFGPIAVRNSLQFFWADKKLRDGDTVFYSQMIDMLWGDRGWAVWNDADLIYLFDNGLKLAARYTLVHAFYRDEHYAPLEPITNPNGPTHKLGPGVLYTFFDRSYQRFNKPTVFLLAQWWIQHRYRTGRSGGGLDDPEAHQAIPQFLLGFVFEGQLLPHPARRTIVREGAPAKERKKR